MAVTDVNTVLSQSRFSISKTIEYNIQYKYIDTEILLLDLWKAQRGIVL